MAPKKSKSKAKAKAKHAPGKAQILFLDAYDSFTYNIVSVIETELNAKVTVVKIDADVGDFATFVKPFAGVIAGPGPGHPGNPSAVGLIAELWKLEDKDLIPVLGVCLGFQSLVLAYGGRVEQLDEPRHGMLRNIRTNMQSMYSDMTWFQAIQYHSLHASVGPWPLSMDLQEKAWPYPAESDVGELELVPLAWEFPADNNPALLGTQPMVDFPVLMAVGHTSRPFFGIQYHPESCCASVEAVKVFSGWWKIANKWNRQHQRNQEMSKLQICAPPSPTPSFNVSKTVHHRRRLVELALEGKIVIPTRAEAMELKRLQREFSWSKARQNAMQGVLELIDDFPPEHPTPPNPSAERRKVSWRAIPVTNLNMTKLDVPTICETLGLHHGEVIVLDSECNQRPETGEHSIIGLVGPRSLRLEYSVEFDHVRCIKDGNMIRESLEIFDHQIFSFLKYFMRSCEVSHGDPAAPFWGGLMGYITYEAGLETLGLESKNSNPCDNDLSFVFVQRSIVINHVKKVIFIQSLFQEDEEWISSTASNLCSVELPAPEDVPANEPTMTSDMPDQTSVRWSSIIPDETRYKSRIRQCRTSLLEGNAYELCLTGDARVYTPMETAPWTYYLRLRKYNPAPFSAYIQLGPLTHLSSSPERFLSWTRKGRKDVHIARKGVSGSSRKMIPLTSTVEFRPIKGTVKKFPGGTGSPPISLEQAIAILQTPKEQAENLMIVDLIRHDLHRVVGSGNVRIPKQMVVEEYSTLFQLVSVIQGALHIEAEDESHESPEMDKCPGTKHNPGECSHNTGIDVLAASLPPGSMTGAPKRRACEILEALTDLNRGLYSGVIGYMDVGGGGDFSVVIRSATRWAKPRRMGPGPGPLADDPWIIGAGGAVTVLSTEEGEWQEMLGKLATTMGVFAPDKDIGGQV